jgi:hypothetical protein
MVEIRLELTAGSVIRVYQINDIWYRYELVTPEKKFLLGGEILEIFIERLESFLNKTDFFEKLPEKGLIAFFENHATIVVAKISKTIAKIKIVNEELETQWEEEVPLINLFQWKQLMLLALES